MVATTLAAGCASPRAADEARSGIAATRAQIWTAKTQLEATVASLDHLVTAPHADPAPPFEAYSKHLDALEAAAADVRERVMEMRADREEYFRRWEREMHAVEVTGLRERQDARMTAARDGFRRFEVHARAARESFAPLVTELRDIRRFLESDLSPQRVKSLREVADDAKKRSAETQKHVDAALAELKALR